MKNKEKITYCGVTDMGRQRTNNEDAYIAEHLDEKTVLAAAIDGVGGYEGGEVAAQIAQTEIPKYMHEYRNGERLELLKQAVICANNAIFEQRQTDEERPNMSCVLTSALIDTGRKVIDMVHVGDTRLYQFHHGTLRKLSHDHSLIGYREEVGDLSEEQAMNHPQRNVISRDVGSALHEVADRDFLEAEEFPLLPNSILLFCSDGLTDLITSKQIVSVLEKNKNLEEKAKELIKAANEAGGKDNVTVVLVEYNAEEMAKPVVKTPEPVDGGSKKEENKLSNPVEGEKEKKKGHKKLFFIIGGIFVLLLLACIGLFIYSLKNSQPTRPEKGNEIDLPMSDRSSAEKDSAPETAQWSTDAIPKPDSKSTIIRYTKAADEDDLETISQVFAANVRQYIKDKNISNEEVVAKHKKYNEKFGVISKHMDIEWDSWDSYRLPNDEELVNYVGCYNMERRDTTQPSVYLLYYHVTLDKEGKIVSIYYDELYKDK